MPLISVNTMPSTSDTPSSSKLAKQHKQKEKEKEKEKEKSSRQYGHRPKTRKTADPTSGPTSTGPSPGTSFDLSAGDTNTSSGSSQQYPLQPPSQPYAQPQPQNRHRSPRRPSIDHHSTARGSSISTSSTSRPVIGAPQPIPASQMHKVRLPGVHGGRFSIPLSGLPGAGSGNAIIEAGSQATIQAGPGARLPEGGRTVEEIKEGRWLGRRGGMQVDIEEEERESDDDDDLINPTQPPPRGGHQQTPSGNMLPLTQPVLPSQVPAVAVALAFPNENPLKRLSDGEGLTGRRGSGKEFRSSAVPSVPSPHRSPNLPPATTTTSKNGSEGGRQHGRKRSTGGIGGFRLSLGSKKGRGGRSSGSGKRAAGSSTTADPSSVDGPSGGKSRQPPQPPQRGVPQGRSGTEGGTANSGGFSYQFGGDGPKNPAGSFTLGLPGGPLPKPPQLPAKQQQHSRPIPPNPAQAQNQGHHTAASLSLSASSQGSNVSPASAVGRLPPPLAPGVVAPGSGSARAPRSLPVTPGGPQSRGTSPSQLTGGGPPPPHQPKTPHGHFLQAQHQAAAGAVGGRTLPSPVGNQHHPTMMVPGGIPGVPPPAASGSGGRARPLPAPGSISSISGVNPASLPPRPDSAASSNASTTFSVTGSTGSPVTTGRSLQPSRTDSDRRKQRKAQERALAMLEGKVTEDDDDDDDDADGEKKKSSSEEREELDFGIDAAIADIISASETSDGGYSSAGGMVAALDRKSGKSSKKASKKTSPLPLPWEVIEKREKARIAGEEASAEESDMFSEAEDGTTARKKAQEKAAALLEGRAPDPAIQTGTSSGGKVRRKPVPKLRDSEIERADEAAAAISFPAPISDLPPIQDESAAAEEEAQKLGEGQEDEEGVERLAGDNETLAGERASVGSKMTVDTITTIGGGKDRKKKRTPSEKRAHKERKEERKMEREERHKRRERRERERKEHERMERELREREEELARRAQEQGEWGAGGPPGPSGEAHIVEEIYQDEEEVGQFEGGPHGAGSEENASGEEIGLEARPKSYNPRKSKRLTTQTIKTPAEQPPMPMVAAQHQADVDVVTKAREGEEGGVNEDETATIAPPGPRRSFLAGEGDGEPSPQMESSSEPEYEGEGTIPEEPEEEERQDTRLSSHRSSRPLSRPVSKASSLPPTAGVEEPDGEEQVNEKNEVDQELTHERFSESRPVSKSSFAAENPQDGEDAAVEDTQIEETLAPSRPTSKLSSGIQETQVEDLSAQSRPTSKLPSSVEEIAPPSAAASLSAPLREPGDTEHEADNDDDISDTETEFETSMSESEAESVETPFLPTSGGTQLLSGGRYTYEPEEEELEETLDVEEQTIEMHHGHEQVETEDEEEGEEDDEEEDEPQPKHRHFTLDLTWAAKRASLILPPRGEEEKAEHHEPEGSGTDFHTDSESDIVSDMELGASKLQDQQQVYQGYIAGDAGDEDKQEIVEVYEGDKGGRDGHRDHESHEPKDEYQSHFEDEHEHEHDGFHHEHLENQDHNQGITDAEVQKIDEDTLQPPTTESAHAKKSDDDEESEDEIEDEARPHEPQTEDGEELVSPKFRPEYGVDAVVQRDVAPQVDSELEPDVLHRTEVPPPHSSSLTAPLQTAAGIGQDAFESEGEHHQGHLSREAPPTDSRPVSGTTQFTQTTEGDEALAAALAAGGPSAPSHLLTQGGFVPGPATASSIASDTPLHGASSVGADHSSVSASDPKSLSQIAPASIRSSRSIPASVASSPASSSFVPSPRSRAPRPLPSTRSQSSSPSLTPAPVPAPNQSNNVNPAVQSHAPASVSLREIDRENSNQKPVSPRHSSPQPPTSKSIQPSKSSQPKSLRLLDDSDSDDYKELGGGTVTIISTTTTRVGITPPPSSSLTGGFPQASSSSSQRGGTPSASPSIAPSSVGHLQRQTPRSSTAHFSNLSKHPARRNNTESTFTTTSATTSLSRSPLPISVPSTIRSGIDTPSTSYEPDMSSPPSRVGSPPTDDERRRQRRAEKERRRAEKDAQKGEREKRSRPTTPSKDTSPPGAPVATMVTPPLSTAAAHTVPPVSTPAPPLAATPPEKSSRRPGTGDKEKKEKRPPLGDREASTQSVATKNSKPAPSRAATATTLVESTHETIPAVPKTNQIKKLPNKPLIGIIGGSGMYELTSGQHAFNHVCTINIATPWGPPSSPITILSLPEQPRITVAFLARHGKHHVKSPTEINYRANIAALKRVGCKAVISFSAVGSLREEIRPGDVVVGGQVIDRTKGIRPSTYFDEGAVAHAAFGDPFDLALNSFLIPKIHTAITSFQPPMGLPKQDTKLHINQTIICMEGPAFSTRAESNMYRMWGADIINMTALPESKLAREAEMAYSIICTATDYDAWRPAEASVTAADVIKTLETNSALSKHITVSVLHHLYKAIDFKGLLSRSVGAMKYSIVTQPAFVEKNVRKRLGYVLPEYFGDEAEEWDLLSSVKTKEEMDAELGSLNLKFE